MNSNTAVSAKHLIPIATASTILTEKINYDFSDELIHLHLEPPPTLPLFYNR